MVKLFFIVSGILQRHAGGFYSQVLYGVHLLGYLRRNAVFNGIKFERLRNKAADFGVKLVFGFMIGTVEKVVVPVRRGNFGNAVFAFFNVCPVFVFVQRTGHNRPNTNNGDRFKVFIFHFVS